MQRVKARLNESPAQLALWRHVEAEPAAPSAPHREQSQLTRQQLQLQTKCDCFTI
jgi:hypothetical protein